MRTKHGQHSGHASQGSVGSPGEGTEACGEVSENTCSTWPCASVLRQHLPVTPTTPEQRGRAGSALDAPAPSPELSGIATCTEELGTPIPSSPGPPPGTTERGERHLQPHTWFRAISSILQPSPRGALPCLCTTEVPCLFSISTGSLKLWFLPTALCPFALCCRETRCDLLLKALPQAHRAHLTQHSLLPFL